MLMNNVLKFLFLSIVVINLVSCSNDELWEIVDENSIRNSSDVNYTKPIIFETEGTNYHTVYDVSKNTYTTTANSMWIDNIYKIKDNFDVPDAIIIEKIVKEEDGKFKALDLSDFKKSRNPETGFFEYSNSLLTMKYTKKDEFSISLEGVDESKDYEYRHFHIYLSNSNGTMGTKIVVNDLPTENLDTGTWPIELDLSNIEYPTKRSYHTSGYKDGFEYYIYIPAEECNVDILSEDLYDIGKISLYDSTSQQYTTLYSLDYEDAIIDRWQPTTPPDPNPTYTVSVEYGTFTFNGKYKISEKGSYSDNGSTLNCQIFKNTTGKERSIILHIGSIPERAFITFIQAAE